MIFFNSNTINFLKGENHHLLKPEAGYSIATWKKKAPAEDWCSIEILALET
jgi:hypothetical protein